MPVICAKVNANSEGIMWEFCSYESEKKTMVNG
jgi:hypothetical protein